MASTLARFQDTMAAPLSCWRLNVTPAQKCPCSSLWISVKSLPRGSVGYTRGLQTLLLGHGLFPLNHLFGGAQTRVTHRSGVPGEERCQPASRSPFSPPPPLMTSQASLALPGSHLEVPPAPGPSTGPRDRPLLPSPPFPFPRTHGLEHAPEADMGPRGAGALIGCCGGWRPPPPNPVPLQAGPCLGLQCLVSHVLTQPTRGLSCSP